MAVPTIERVRKHRARHGRTPEGRERMRAKGREYKARSRRKRRIRELTKERDEVEDELTPAQLRNVGKKAAHYRDSLREKAGVDRRVVNTDEQQITDIRVLEYELEMMKQLRKFNREVDIHVNVVSSENAGPIPMMVTSIPASSTPMANETTPKDIAATSMPLAPAPMHKKAMPSPMAVASMPDTVPSISATTESSFNASTLDIGLLFEEDVWEALALFLHEPSN